MVSAQPGLTTVDINSGLPRKSAEGAATPPSPCRIAHSARLSLRSRKRGRPTRCRAGISDRYIQRLPGRSHTLDGDFRLLGDIPVHKDIGWIEDLGDRSARHQRLTDMRETCRNYSGDRRKDMAAC